MQLHGSLQDLRQDDDIVTLYLQHTEVLFDELVATDIPISLTDFNLYVSRGLCGEFRDLVTSQLSSIHSACCTPTAHTCAAFSAYAAHRGFSRSIGSGFMAHRGRGRRGDWWHPRINFPQSSGQYFHGAGGGSLG